MMLHAQLTPRDSNSLNRGGFRWIFEQSRIPMALVDRNRRYVSVNDAVIELYQYPRGEVVGQLAGRTAIEEEPATADARWQQLVRTDELYGEGVITHANGKHMEVSYAA